MDQGAATGAVRFWRAAVAGARPGGRPRQALLVLVVLCVGVLLSMFGCATEGLTTSTAVPPAGQGPGSSRSLSGASIGAPDPPVIKIGALFPLTGDLAGEGQSSLRGMRQAIEAVNAAGGIPSLGGALFTLVEADSEGDAEIGSQEVQRRVREDGVAAVVGTGQSTVALLASETAEKLQVPFVVSAAAADDITQRGLTYTFRLCPPADWYARDQVAFLQALKLKGTEVSAVALLHERGEFGRRTAESEIAYLAQAGIAVVADIEYSASQADVHDEILRIKQSGAQALLTATLLSDAALIADDLAVLHVNIPMVDAAGGVLDPAFIGQAGFAAENVMSVAECAQGIVPSRDLQPEAQGSGETIEADALYGYQAVVLLASALERAGAAGGAEIRDALALTALSGDELVLPQDVLTFDQTGQNQGARLLVVQVQDGRLVPVWPHQYAQAAVRLP